VVAGTINPRTGTDGVAYGIRFQLKMPADWNDRFFFQGGGGFDGVLSDANGVINPAQGNNNVALSQGYAVVSTDGGHDNAKLVNQVAFGLDEQARVDFGYNAIDKTTTTAKSIIQTAYDSSPEHSYFVGCSNGGRQGLEFAQRFPDYFDGIIGGSPVMDLAAQSVSGVFDLQTFAKISPTGTDGKPEYYKAFSASDQALFNSAYMAKCDKSDGVVDGMVQNPLSCQFDVSTLQCSGAKNDSCLSPEQVGAVKAVVNGAVTSSGTRVTIPGYYMTHETGMEGYPIDPGWMTATGQAGRLIGSAASPVGSTLGSTALPYLHLQTPDPSFDPMSANWDTLPDKMTVNPPWLSTNPDISKFKAHGGKMMLFNGTTDPGPFYLNTINYFNKVAQLNGGTQTTQSFFRIYLVPGMGHCSGGASTDSFDMLKPMVDWVEKGISPDTIIASSRANNSALNAVLPAVPANRTRPLCAYPKAAKYKGTGNIEDASNFTCS
jgi:feruloyl esterase